MIPGIVSTIKDRCKRCYSCIRECPAKAIKVVSGQAIVMEERCIACGHCTKVCSQDAKQILSYKPMVSDWIYESNGPVAILAPSFAASWHTCYNRVPSALRKLGFSRVIEAAFGADLISSLYANDVELNGGGTIISSSCPAVCNYVEMYFKPLVPNLAKIVSPMVAVGRYLRENLPEGSKLVFIGPCIAKKAEMNDAQVAGVIDAVLTFDEVKEMFHLFGINPEEADEQGFDAPHAFMGKSYPLAGGLLKTAEIPEDVLTREVIVVEGKGKVVEIIEELAEQKINARFIDILFCEGCISGPAIDSNLNYYSRRDKVIEFIHDNIRNVDRQVWKSDLYNSRRLNLRRDFVSRSQRRAVPDDNKIKEVLAEINKQEAREELNCGACGYPTCREFAIAVAKGLGEKEMCLPFLIDELQLAYQHLRSTQEQLHSAEKLASIGQLAAGIAHEINNPLGTIMLYSSLLRKELQKAGVPEQAGEDLQLILSEANRCKVIVSDLLNFARQGKLRLTEFDFGDLLHEVLRKAGKNPRFSGITFNLSAGGDTVLQGDRDQIEQVITNLVFNACEAMEECASKKLTAAIAPVNAALVLTVTDTGCGIEKENFNKIFTPFFTTKKIGKGTGLGMAIAYGIVKMHKGDISFQSEPGKGTTFFVRLPRCQEAAVN